MSILCTIAIPVYNRRNEALKAVRSALAQDIPGILEVLAIDDGSTDGATEALEALSSSSLRVVRNEKNLGLFANFNECLRLAQGEYFRLLCTDDELIEGTIRKEIDIMRAHPEVSLISTRGLLCNSSGDVIENFATWLSPGLYPHKRAIDSVLKWNSRHGMNALNYPSGILIRKSAIEQTYHFRTDMLIAGDVEYFLRLTKTGQLYVADVTGCKITQHNNQQGTKLSTHPDAYKEWLSLLKEHQHTLGAHSYDEAVTNYLALWLASIIKLYMKGKRSEAKRLQASWKESLKTEEVNLFKVLLKVLLVPIGRCRLKNKRYIRG